MTNLSIDAERLLARIWELGQIGRDDTGRLIRLACSDTDKAGRDKFVLWARKAGLDVAVDRIGNIFGIWKTPDNADKAPFCSARTSTPSSTPASTTAATRALGARGDRDAEGGRLHAATADRGRRLHQRGGRALCRPT